MSHIPKRDPRVRPVPQHLLDKARSLLEQYGANDAAKQLHISRNALLGVVATGYAMQGTIAILERPAA